MSREESRTDATLFALLRTARGKNEDAKELMKRMKDHFGGQ